MDPAVAFNQALVARLRASVPSVAGHVYDASPASVPFPHVEIAAIQVLDDGAACIDGFELFATINVWSRATGQRQAREICAAIRAAVHDHDLPVAGYALIELQHRRTLTRRDADGQTTQGVVELRALLNRVA